MRFLSLTTLLLLSFPGISQAASENIHLRGSLQNSLLKFEQEKQGHVAFMGGSITEMNGYRPMVCEDLQKRFPGTKFNFTAAGISSTCSTSGAFRLQRDVLSQGPVDLFLVEFAVNDNQDAHHTRQDCIRGLEGIIRHLRQHNPQADIVVVYFVNPPMLETLQTGKTPLTIAAHESVCRHYDVPSVNLAKEVAQQRITADKLTWKVYGGTHPAPAGNRICADLVAELLDAAWSKPAPSAELKPHPLPDQPLDPQSYSQGHFVEPTKAQVKNGWEWNQPNWAELPGSKRSRFTEINMLSADQPGAELTLEFAGTAVGAFVVAGPDAGIVEASVDGGDFHPVDLYHQFSRGLHYPRTVMFAADLEPGKHTLLLRVAADKNEASQGHAARIMQFAVNGPQ